MMRPAASHHPRYCHWLTATAAVLTTLTAVANTARAQSNDILARAIECHLASHELDGLPDSAAGQLKLLRHFALPTGELYQSDHPVSAWGMISRMLYIQPGRIALVTDRSLASVIRRLGLVRVPLSPASRPVGAGLRLVAWQLGQKGLVGKTLVGCEYDGPGDLD